MARQKRLCGISGNVGNVAGLPHVKLRFKSLSHQVPRAMAKCMGGSFPVRLAAVLMLMASAVLTAGAETIAWYRFAEGTAGSRIPSSTAIVNYASPGVLDGICGQVDVNGVLSFVDAGYFPYSHGAFPANLGISDPVDRVKHANDRAFYFHTSKWDQWDGVSVIANADQGYGSCVVVPYDSRLALAGSWTVECMFRSAVTNNQGAGFQTILAFRNSSSSSNRYSWHVFTHKDGTIRAEVYPAEGTAIFSKSLNVNAHDGRWHHVALRCSSEGSGTSYKYSLCYDYGQMASASSSAPAYYNPDAALPLVIGCTPGNQYRRWCGWIDEVRISGEHLSIDEFLRPAMYMTNLTSSATACFVTYGEEVTNFWGQIKTGWTNVNLNSTADYGPRAFMSWCAKATAPELDTSERYAATIYGMTAHDTVFQRMEIVDTSSVHQITNGIGYAASLYVDDRVDGVHTVLGDSFTLELFAKAHERPHSRGAYLLHLGAEINKSMMLYALIRGNNALEFGAATNKASETMAVTSFATYPGFCDGKWHHVAITYDRVAQVFSAWVDYELLGKLSGVDFPYQDSAAPLQVGGGYAIDANLKFNGWIDDFRMSRLALSRKEFLSDVKHIVGTQILIR